MSAFELLFAAHGGEHHQREEHIAEHRLRIKQRRPLEQHAYLLAQLLDLIVRHTHHVAAVIKYLSLLGLQKADDRLYQHCLA